MEEAVTRQHAHPNTVFHCLYGYYWIGYSRARLAHIYRKTVRTIGNWIIVYEQTGTYQRADSRATRKFTVAHRKWLLEFNARQPLAYLDEARDGFIRTHQVSISTSTMWLIIHEGGLIRKVLEKRAMHIKEHEVFRFVEELSHINWFYSIIFLDEVSFDNRGMIRTRAVEDELVLREGRRLAGGVCRDSVASSSWALCVKGAADGTVVDSPLVEAKEKPEKLVTASSVVRHRRWTK